MRSEAAFGLLKNEAGSLSCKNCVIYIRCKWRNNSDCVSCFLTWQKHFRAMETISINVCRCVERYIAVIGVRRTLEGTDQD